MVNKYRDNMESINKKQSEINNIKDENSNLVVKIKNEFEVMGEVLIEADYAKFMKSIEYLFKYALSFKSDQGMFKGSPNEAELLELIKVMK